MASILDRIFRLYERPESPEKRSVSMSAMRGFLLGSKPSTAGVRVDQKVALAVNAVYSSTRVLSEGVATLPLHMYERFPDGSRQRITDDQLVYLLTVSPNPNMTAYEWRELMMFCLCLRGNSFNRIQRNGAGAPIAIWPMHPDFVKLNFTDDGELIYEYQPNGKSLMRLPARDVIHVKGMSENGLIGMSPLDVLADSMGYAYAMQSYGARLFANDARPSGVLKHPAAIDDDVYNRMRESWLEAHSGGKQHSIAILEDGVEYVPISISPEHAQFLESKKLSRSEIAGAFRVPAHMIGDLEKATFSNISEQDRFFAVHTLTPWCERIEQALMFKLIPPSKRSTIYLEHSLEGLLRGDVEKRSKYYQTMWQMGAMSINEIRQKENMNAVEGGDTYYVPMNFVPMGFDYTPKALPEPAQESEEAPELKCGCGHDHEVRALPAGSKDVSKKIKAAKARQKLIASFKPVLEDAMTRVVRREVQQIKAAAKKHLNRTQQEFEDFLHTFYQDTSYTEQQVRPAFEALRNALGVDVYSEINEEWEDNPALQAWAEQYIQTFAAHHALSGRSQLQQLLRQTEIDLYEALEQRLTEWEEGIGGSGSTRAFKVAEHETLRFGNAFAMVALAGAVSEARFVWRSVGETCPICVDMDGTVVGYGESFTDGKEGNLKDANGEPFKPSGPCLQPPLHSGCDCVVTLE